MIYTGTPSKMTPHWGSGLAELVGPEGLEGKCTLRFRTQFLVPSSFLFYVGPWALNGVRQEGIARVGIRSAEAIKVPGEGDLVEIRGEVRGTPLLFTGFKQYLT